MSMSASDLVQPFIGLGTEIVKDYFNIARKNSPCIIFIDELDSLTPRNMLGGSYSAHLNQLLTEMDGFKKSDNIVVIGATNREEMVDGALKRSGRFDLKVHIPLPFRKSREELINHFVKFQKVEANFDVQKLAKKTVGFSPADIKNLINLSSIDAIKLLNFKKNNSNDFIKIEKDKLLEKQKSKIYLEIEQLNLKKKNLDLKKQQLLNDLEEVKKKSNDENVYPSYSPHPSYSKLELKIKHISECIY